MQPRPIADCCTFGSMFSDLHDEKFASLSVREAFEYFASLRKKSERPVKKFMVEKHRECLALVRPRTPEDEERLLLKRADDLARAAEDKRKREAADKLRQEARDVVAEALDMSPKDLEFEERAMQIVNAVESGSWTNGSRIVLGLKKNWKVGDKYIVRLMERAQSILVDGRGGVPFAREISVQKTIAIREKAIEKEDWKGAIGAQKHLDQITGVLAPSSVQINQQINIAAHPQFRQVLDRIFTEVAAELDEHPDLLDRIQQRLARCLANVQRPILVESVQ